MRILLIEDEPDLGTAIQKVLSREKYIVDWVLDGAEAWEYLDQSWTQYEIAIVDWMLPSLSGLELCQRLRSKNNPLPVLMLTARDRIEDRVTGLDAGADDYLVKPFGMTELLARLRALQRRSPQVQPQHLQVGNLKLDATRSFVVIQTSPDQSAALSLTPKEFQLLEYLMKHPNQIVSSDQIRNQLWQLKTETTSNVVAAQMRLLRRKLENQGCEGLIETVYGLGYRLNPAASIETREEA